MKDAAPQAVYLKDYTAPEFKILSTELVFDLHEDHALVNCTLQIQRQVAQAPLVLNGQDLELLELLMDGQPVSPDAYRVEADSLTITQVPDLFSLSCTTRIKPHLNTSLEGLYKSRSMFCTQCEAEGFRKITYYLDRPDVLSVFTTTIKADAVRYPVLLSNGNLMVEGPEEGGRHFATWHDPFPKPAYLFALVAGKLANIDDHFTTASGREVLLRIFVEEKDLDKCDHAMQSLKNSMAWDEKVYGREYDLDIFMIVAVDDFNMGAMENKGLNIFNTSCVLANPATTTDAGFQRVESVVAHEYFHNWSGNRVTCRDWFQLSLKEGFTVFRDTQFSADMNSPTVKRVEDVQFLRTYQFAEDAGPMAHPVQPPSFIEISNFYTLTVYEKGSEVVRMIHTLLGPELFRKGSDLYFERHDGQAVTIEDFVRSMSDASGRDFSQFMRWYRQAGTPVLEVRDDYNAGTGSYTLHVRQRCPTTPEARADQKQPFHIPLAMALVGERGPLPLYRRGQSDSGELHCVLEVTEAEQWFVFDRLSERPVPSLLRGFSAPVKLVYHYSEQDLLRLIRSDDDGFTRWDACQQLALVAIRQQMDNAPMSAGEHLVEALGHLLRETQLDPAMVALMLELPAESYIGDQFETVDVDAVHAARDGLRLSIAKQLEGQLLATYERCRRQLGERSTVDAATIAQRSLMNRCLGYLVLIDEPQYQALCLQQYKAGRNMTEVLASMTALVHCPHAGVEDSKQQILDDFYARWNNEALVVNQWLSVQATSPLPGTLNKVKALTKSPAYDGKNPNKIRSLVGVFCNQNLVNFHTTSGEGYVFLADQVIALNQVNPQIAARLVTPLTKWRRFDSQRSRLMREQLERVAKAEGLSKDVFEVVNKSL